MHAVLRLVPKKLLRDKLPRNELLLRVLGFRFRV